MTLDGEFIPSFTRPSVWKWTRTRAVLSLRLAGATPNQIAAVLQICNNTVYDVLRKNGQTKRRSTFENNTLYTVHLDKAAYYYVPDWLPRSAWIRRIGNDDELFNRTLAMVTMECPGFYPV